MVHPVAPERPGDPWLCPVCGADLEIDDGDDVTTFHCTPTCGYLYQEHTPRWDDTPDDGAE